MGFARGDLAAEEFLKTQHQTIGPGLATSINDRAAFQCSPVAQDSMGRAKISDFSVGLEFDVPGLDEFA